MDDRKPKGSPKKTGSEEFQLPRYPALQRCLLIDARHSSRQEVLRGLKASELFDEISEAKSLNDGMNMLRTVEFDACVIGPSVSLSNVLRFLVRSEEVAMSKDCAKIVTLYRDEPLHPDHEREVLSHAHGIVFHPCSRQSLTDWLVRAVIRANEASPWAQIFQESGHANLVVEDPFAKKHTALFSGDISQSGTFSISRPGEQTIEAAIAATYMLDNDSPLKRIVAGVESGEFRLDPTGAPTPRTKEELNRVMSEVVGEDNMPDVSKGTHDSEIVAFIEFYEQQLSQWVVDLIHLPTETAEENLRKAILEYQTTRRKQHSTIDLED